MSKLPVVATVKAAIADVWDHKLEALRVLWPYLAVMVVFTPLSLIMRGQQLAVMSPAEALHKMTLLVILQMIVLLCILIWTQARWVRWVVERHTGVPLARTYWGRSLWVMIKFLGVVLLCYIALILAIMIVAVVGKLLGKIGFALDFVGGLAGFCALIWFWLRLSLAIPVACAGAGSDLGIGWQITRGNCWRLFGAGLLILLLAMVTMLIFLALGFILTKILAPFGNFVPVPELSVKANLFLKLQAAELGWGFLVASILMIPVQLGLQLVGFGFGAHAYLALRRVPETAA